MPRLRTLWIRNFRNYPAADLRFGDGISALVGPNGQGKSNLLEAIYLVATGRSHRTANEAETIRHGETTARVRAQVSRRGRVEELDITLRMDAGRVATTIRVNGVETPRGSLLGRLPVVMAAPWDMEMVRGGAAGRRRLLDSALAQLSPAYFFALHRYHRVVAQRNAELRRRTPGGLDPWDAQLVALGVRITADRARHAARLQPHVGAWFQALGGEGALTVTYRPSWAGATEEERMATARAQITRNRADEYRRGVTLTGPHRDDLEFSLSDVPLRANGSQGQWRTAMLAVRMAERAVMAADLGADPVVLLDDALAELDPSRQRRVLEVDDDTQMFVTATVLPVTGRAVRVFAVEAGTIREGEWSPRFETS